MTTFSRITTPRAVVRRHCPQEWVRVLNQKGPHSLLIRIPPRKGPWARGSTAGINVYPSSKLHLLSPLPLFTVELAACEHQVHESQTIFTQKPMTDSPSPIGTEATYALCFRCIASRRRSSCRSARAAAASAQQQSLPPGSPNLCNRSTSGPH